MQDNAYFRTVQTIVFDVGGRPCTDVTARAAVRRAMELEIGHLVVATTTGWTASRVMSAAREAGYRGQVVVVGEHTGYHHTKIHQALTPEMRRQLEAEGAKIFIGTHAFSSISRSFRLRWGGIDMVETVAETLRRVSRGTKVCCEIAVMAADADLIPTDRDVVAMGGSGDGADTAVVIRSANMNRFFDLKIREFIALPRLRVAEVLAAVIEQTEQGADASAIAGRLQVSPDLVGYYQDLYQRVKVLVAKGVPLAEAIEQAGGGRQSEVAESMKHLFGLGGSD